MLNINDSNDYDNVELFHSLADNKNKIDDFYNKLNILIDKYNLFLKKYDNYLYEFNSIDYQNISKMHYELENKRVGFDYNIMYYHYLNDEIVEEKKCEFLELTEKLEKIAQRIIILKERASFNCLNDYLSSHSSLTHLVLTNNKDERIKPCGLANYMFLCQFHDEKSPSLCVFESNNNGYCYGCGISFDPISYLRNIHNLSHEDSMKLLAKIYNYKIDNNDFNDISLIDKYKESLLSDEYENLIMAGYNRSQKKLREYTLNSFRIEALKKFKSDSDLVQRVYKNEYKKLWIKR